MKKIILSAAVAAMALSTSAVAADKGIDIDVTGQAVIYYETHEGNGQYGVGQNKPATTSSSDMLDQDNSTAAAGIQLNLGSDLGNNFTFGSQLTYIASLGLENSAVNGLKQTAGSNGVRTTDEIALTKIFIAKKIGNTTLKAGRQELPKSLSPLAFTEGWNVFKNTFDATLVVNTDLPKTTVVGAYVAGGTSTTGATLTTSSQLAGGAIAGGAYMLTAQTKLIPMTTLTGSYYYLKNVGTTVATKLTDNVDATAYWVDAVIAPKDAPLGLKLSLQAAQISPDSQSTLVPSATGGATYTDTDAFGATLTTSSQLAGGAIAGGAYMLTAQTKLIPMTTLTGSYYYLKNVGTTVATKLTDNVDATAYWVDAVIAPKDAPLGLKLSLQAAQISPDSQSTLVPSATGGATYTDTDAFGAKLTAKVAGIDLKAIYTTVGGGNATDGQIAMRNVGTTVKTALYSQMMYNQNAITLDNDTVVVGAGYDMGDMGSIAANYGMTEVGQYNSNTVRTTTASQDYNELDLVYKVKSGGVQYFAIAAIRDWGDDTTMNTTTTQGNANMTDDKILRFWARYNF